MQDGKIVLNGVTVVGKVDLEQPDTKKDRFDSLKNHSVHFRKRLFERYNISISFREYRMINSKTKWPKESVFTLKVKGTDVRVVQRSGLLITALPFQKTK